MRLQLNTHAPYACGFEYTDTVNWLYGVNRTCAETAAVSRGTGQPCNSQTPLRRKLKRVLCNVTQSPIQSRIRLERSGSARKQRIALYSCHCEALRAHLEFKQSISVHLTVIMINWFPPCREFHCTPAETS